MTTQIIHSFDVETSTPRIGPGGLISVGVCCTELKPNGRFEVINQFFVTIDWTNSGGLRWDHPDTAAFWSRHPEALRINTADPVPPAQAGQRLWAHIKGVHDTTHKRGARYVLLVDNAYFDVPWIDWFLGAYCPEALPLRHNYCTGWLAPAAVVNISERVQGLKDLGIEFRRNSFQPTTAHDHNPVHDARALAERYIHYLQYLQGLRRSQAYPQHQQFR